MNIFDIYAHSSLKDTTVNQAILASKWGSFKNAYTPFKMSF